MSNLKSFKDLVRLAPKELQQVFWKQWKAPQNPNFHPEGNTLKHIAVVVSRAIKNHPNDINIILSAFFHDLGKFFTLDFKNNQPTAHGHEKVSVEEDNYVDQDMIVETLSIIEMNINSMLNIPIFKQYYDSKG